MKKIKLVMVNIIIIIIIPIHLEPLLSLYARSFDSLDYDKDFDPS